MSFDDRVSDEVLDRIAEAIRIAGCPDREGPFGLYNYEARGGSGEKAHTVRDFRDTSSPDFGSHLHVCGDPVEARRIYDEMTRRHVALAAWLAMRPDVAGQLPSSAESS